MRNGHRRSLVEVAPIGVRAEATHVPTPEQRLSWTVALPRRLKTQRFDVTLYS